MKRFVIHIKGERTERMLNEMNSQYKDEFEVFPAIINKDAYKGISASFRKIIEENYNEPFIHIFEDDVKFTSDKSREVFENGFRNLPDDWELYLGGSYTFKEEEDKGSILRISDFRSFHDIIVRKSCYDIFLSHDFDVFKNIDTWVSSLVKNVYICNPQIAVQHNGYSYNRGKIVDYDHYLLNKKILT